MTDTITAPVLTAHDVRALRNANTICVDHLADGTGRIRAIRDADKSPSGFTETHVIPAHMSTVESYGTSLPAYTAYVHVWYPNNNDLWRTILGTMTAGKAIRLMWTRDNNNQVYPAVGFHRDELRIRVGTPEKKDAKTFLVDVYVGPDNTARMIRGA